MNNSKKLPIIIAAVVAVVALIVGGIFFLNQDKSGNNTPVPNSTPKTSTSASPDPSTSASASPSPSSTDAAKNYEDTRKFDEATQVSGFSQDDVKDILKLSADYADSSLNNDYYLSGQWVKDGMPNNLNDRFGRFFTADVRKEITAFDTNPKTGKTIGKDVMPIVFYVYPNDLIDASPYCAVKNDSDNSAPKRGELNCPLDGLKLTDMKYTPTSTNDTPGVRVEFSATAKIPVKMKSTGKDYFTEVKYDYNLNFISNEGYQPELDPNKFVINSYNVTVTIGAIQELK